MNSLVEYIKEEMVTPANTMGAGNVVVCDETGRGNTPALVTTKKKPLKKKAKTKKSEEE